MIVNQLRTLHDEVAQSYRPLCAAATLPYPTFMRWSGRVTRGEAVLQKPGPKTVGVLDVAGLREQLRGLKHGPQRSRGAPAIYAEHRPRISRRVFGGLVKEARREALREREADTRRIEWLVPAAVWSVDPTELVLVRNGQRQKVPLLPVIDLASRYKLPPLVGHGLTGKIVAARMEELFRQFGAPLVLKRDNGSNLNSAEVEEVLSRWRVIPLNSPPYYPPYNGGIERAQRDLKTALRPLLLTHPGCDVAMQTAWMVHELNHRPRRCLRGRSACEKFAGAKQNLRAYTARVRKEAFERIRDQAMKIMVEQPGRTQGHADAAWRRAVETWLLQNEIITISQPKTVTPFP
jgi:transposase InsO family protein